MQKLGNKVQRHRKMHIVIFYEPELNREAGFKEHECLPSQVLGSSLLGFGQKIVIEEQGKGKQ